MNASEPPPSPGRPSADERRAALAGRTGYDETFLGPVVPLALPVRQTVETVILPYTHFTVVFRPDRRLAASTAVCIEGRELLLDTGREDVWEYDPRLPEERQAGDEIYRNNSLDRGHLVRRLDPVWGDRATAALANTDTFHFTNAAPQADVFNQGKQLWQGLENYLLDHAAVYDRRLTVLTGPVLHDSDPPYRGIQVPMRFWKVAAFLQVGALVQDVRGGGERPVLDERGHLPEPQRHLHPPVRRIGVLEHRAGEHRQLPVVRGGVVEQVVLQALPELLALVEDVRLGRRVGEVEGCLLYTSPSPRDS